MIQQVKLFGSKMFSGTSVEGHEVQIEGLVSPGIIYKDGLLVSGNDGKKVRLIVRDAILDYHLNYSFSLIHQVVIWFVYDKEWSY